MSEPQQQKDYSPLLSDHSKQFITADEPPIKRKIIAAANLHPETGLLLVGARHWSPAMRKQYTSLKYIPNNASFMQGFIDQFDQFVTRDDAKEIATINKQNLIGKDWETLYSENLY